MLRDVKCVYCGEAIYGLTPEEIEENIFCPYCGWPINGDNWPPNETDDAPL